MACRFPLGPLATPAVAAAATAAVVAFGLVLGLTLGCSSPGEIPGLPPSDFCPPVLLDAQVRDARSLVLAFDEDVSVLASAFALEPSGEAVEASADQASVVATFGRALAPGGSYRLAGEVEDAKGNRTRFVIDFVGFNPQPAPLLLSEVRTARNSSTTTPHRDYVEFRSLAEGNLGGMELSWLSGTKVLTYRFPAAVVAPGGFVVLHLAPAGTAAEVDETGEDRGLSGGIDSCPTARDFWTGAGGLADATGFLILRDRPGGRILDGLFYADQAKTGALPEGSLKEGVVLLAAGGFVSPGALSYEAAFRWKPSTSRSLVHLPEGGWALGDAGAETPGLPNPAPGSPAAAKVRKPTTAP